MTEPLEKALHTVAFLRDELREAHGKCTAVESLILLPLIQRATEMERDIQALANARGATCPWNCEGIEHTGAVNSGCGKSFISYEDDMFYCPYCGKPIAKSGRWI